jgi:hypothetical protein
MPLQPASDVPTPGINIANAMLRGRATAPTIIISSNCSRKLNLFPTYEANNEKISKVVPLTRLCRGSTDQRQEKMARIGNARNTFILLYSESNDGNWEAIKILHISITMASLAMCEDELAVVAASEVSPAVGKNIPFAEK